MLFARNVVLCALLHVVVATTWANQPAHSIERRSPSWLDRLSGKLDKPKATKPEPHPLPQPRPHASNNGDTPGSLPRTRPKHLDPFKNKGDEVSSGLNAGIARQAIEGFVDWAIQQWAGPDISQTPTSTVSSMSFDSLPSMIAKATASPLTYYAVVDQWLPSKDVALQVADRNDLLNYSHLLAPAEYTMYQNDPLCYFANIEEMHRQYFLTSFDEQSEAEASASPPETTEAPSKRNLQARAFSPEDMSLYTQLFAHVLQEQMADIHLAEPSATSGSATAMMVAETSCAGLSGINDRVGVSTSYRVLEVMQTSTPGSGSSGSGLMVSSSTAAREVRLWPLLLFVAIVSFGRC